jgi:hypothetical protein
MADGRALKTLLGGPSLWVLPAGGEQAQKQDRKGRESIPVSAF